MIGRTVAFNSKNISAGNIRIRNREIHKEAGDAYLSVDVMAARSECLSYLLFKNTIVVATCTFCHSHAAGSGKVQEKLEREHALSRGCTCEVRIDVLIRHRRENLATTLGTANEHVQTSFS